MNKKIFNSAKHDPVICPSCYSSGYIYNPNHQVCPRCVGGGFVRIGAERDTNIPLPRNDELTKINRVPDVGIPANSHRIKASVLRALTALYTILLIRKNPIDIPPQIS
jgi:hypothetical protein